MILKTLNDLGLKNIDYVSWKNNHLIRQSIAGERDVDLYVPLVHKASFEKVLKDDNWIKVDKKFIRYPWITHFYKIDAKGSNYHFHVYYKIVTGESGLKEYELPWGLYFINNRIKNEYGIWVLNKEAQSFIYFVRHLLKNSSFQSRRQYKKEIESYGAEFAFLGCSLEFNSNNYPLNINGFIKGSGLTGKKIKQPKVKLAKRFRRKCFLFRRSLFPLYLSRSIYLYYRVLNKFFYRTKKIMLDGGLVIGVTGIDGSGKTTMLENLRTDTKSFMTVKNIHMGKPLPKILSKAIELFYKNKKNTDEEKQTKCNNQESSIPSGLYALLIAFYRLRRARQCMRYARQGCLVVTDRWPTQVRGKMDGPKVISKDDGSKAIRFMENFEKKLYQMMPSADVCFIFTVSLEVALKRNACRDVSEREDELIKRYLNNKIPRPITHKTIKFKNEGELEEQLQIFRDLYWKEIVNTQG